MDKRNARIYWITTAIVCAVMVYSIINFNLKNPIGPEVYRTEGPFRHLGLPDYFRVELTIAKTLGVLALLIPAVPAKIKEFAYFGFAITLASAAFAHYSSGDGFIFIIDPLIFLCVLSVSYRYFRKIEQGKKSAGIRDKPQGFLNQQVPVSQQ